MVLWHVLPQKGAADAVLPHPGERERRQEFHECSQKIWEENMMYTRYLFILYELSEFMFLRTQLKCSHLSGERCTKLSSKMRRSDVSKAMKALVLRLQLCFISESRLQWMPFQYACQNFPQKWYEQTYQKVVESCANTKKPNTYLACRGAYWLRPRYMNYSTWIPASHLACSNRQLYHMYVHKHNYKT